MASFPHNEEHPQEQLASGGVAEYVSNASVMSFAPISRIHQHLIGLHCYAYDRTRAVPSHHFCSCSPTNGVRQCIIYDSDKPDARLIGIEYVVDESVFESLPQEEKKFWHSHKHEVESGTLQLGVRALVPRVAEDLAEQNAMRELHKTYGKTIHTWAIDKHPSLPLGPPSLMMARQPTDDLAPKLKEDYDARVQYPVQEKHEHRKTYLDMSYEIKGGCDQAQGEFVWQDKTAKTGQWTWQGPGDLNEKSGERV